MDGKQGRLILSRKEGEEIMINGNVRVTIISIRRRDGKVKLGFTAPREVPIHRKEIFDLIQAENKE